VSNERLSIVEKLRVVAGLQFTPYENELVGEAADTIERLVAALDQCRAIIKFHVKPERCVTVGDEVLSARKAFEDAVEALQFARNA
jgi:hypothetical protein